MMLAKMKNGMTIDDLDRYRNKINGIIYYSYHKTRTVWRDGQEYLPVFEYPHRPRIVYIARSALERLPASANG